MSAPGGGPPPQTPSPVSQEAREEALRARDRERKRAQRAAEQQARAESRERQRKWKAQSEARLRSSPLAAIVFA